MLLQEFLLLFTYKHPDRYNYTHDHSEQQQVQAFTLVVEEEVISIEKRTEDLYFW